MAGTVAALARSRWCRLPAGVTARHVMGLGPVCGLGFTVAPFVNQLAYRDPVFIAGARTGVLDAEVFGSAAATLVFATRSPTAGAIRRADSSAQSV
ncbi:Na+/H+ antiporter NhaA [Kitasatospora mediocidica]|uniref:Na+/H+ antiporter NhaA n=1 Tax=Kitasatospora mediocidica TaxID=58352 RepID=UPI0018DB89C6|nr:Na+/H+ antiporter NhaA [Kitasatospora mediocidica]